MATWKKVIVSGSQAQLQSVYADNLTQNNILAAGAGGIVENSGITLSATTLDLGNRSIYSTGGSSVLSGSFTGTFEGDGSALTGLVSTLSTSGNGGAGTIDLQTQTLSIVGGQGIGTSASGQTITISGSNASTTTKGIASFNSGDFTVSNGAVSAKDISVTSTNGLSTTATTVGLGGSINLSVGEGIGIDVTANNVAIKNAGSLSSNTLTKWDNTNDQFVNSIVTDDGTKATVGGNLVVSGDLTIQGTTTTIDTANLLIEDRFILLNSGSANPDEGGLVIDEGAGTGHAFIYEADLGKQRWGFNQSVSSTATTANATAYAAAVVDVDGSTHTDSTEYQKNGNIKVEGGEIWIYS